MSRPGAIGPIRRRALPGGGWHRPASSCLPSHNLPPPPPPRPFLDLLHVDSKESRRIWQSSPPHYEYTSSILSDLDTDRPVSLDSLRVLASRESVTEPPQVGRVAVAGAGARRGTAGRSMGWAWQGLGRGWSTAGRSVGQARVEVHG